MKRLLLIPLVLFVLSCENEEDDTVPPIVSIIYPSDESVFEIVSIICMSTDKYGIDRVELWVDGEFTGVIDDTEPYSLNWNTTTYENGVHVIIVRSYDNSGNTNDSNPLTLIVDDLLAYPSYINFDSILCGDENCIITWNKSLDDDYFSYELEKSMDWIDPGDGYSGGIDVNELEMNIFESIYTTQNLTDTSYTDGVIDSLCVFYSSERDTIFAPEGGWPGGHPYEGLQYYLQPVSYNFVCHTYKISVTDIFGYKTSYMCTLVYNSMECFDIPFP